MTMKRWAAAACCAAMLGMLSGCDDAPQQTRRSNFLKDNAWVAKKPGQSGSAGTNPVVERPGDTRTTGAPGDSALAAQSAGGSATYKPDSEVVSPILNARGNWTVRLAFYNPTPDKGLSALYYANQHARELRRKGYDAYVTDLISKAIVTVGAFDSENDPKLVELWRQSYEDWMKIYGGHKSPFRESMEQFYGNKTVFGDQPWPVSIIDLQIKMKGAYKIPLTEEDKQRYKDYISKRAKTGENS